MASRVGQYLLFETLGEGAFGKVKLGVHEETGEQVAVKIMDKSDIRAQEMTMNVRREIAIMKALKHKNIVNLRQVLTSSSKLYIVMDLVTGGELFTKILNEGKLEENVARSYFQQLVDGIDYCHRRGVCHRDLKPENLLIDEGTGELKITDFGLSAMKGASTAEELLHTQCGSPNYCAPEIIARHRQGYNGAKVDAWSCGIILFALLAGFLPFYDENTKVLYRMIQRDDVKFPRKFPPEAKDLVLRLLHKEPERRFTLQEVKKHAWFVVGYNGDQSGPSNSSPPTSSQGRRRRRGHNRTRSSGTDPRSRTSAENASNSSASQASSQAAPVPAAAPAATAPPPQPAPRVPQPAPPVPVSAPVPHVPPVPPPAPVQPAVVPAVKSVTAAPPAPAPTPVQQTPPLEPVVAPQPPAAPPVPVIAKEPIARITPPIPPPSRTVPQAVRVPLPPVQTQAPAPPARAPPPIPPPPMTTQRSPVIEPIRRSPVIEPVRRSPVIEPIRRASPPPPIPPPARPPADYKSSPKVERLDDPGVGNTISIETRNESIPDVEKEAFEPRNESIPDVEKETLLTLPSGSPVTSSSEVNSGGPRSIRQDLPMFGAPLPKLDAGANANGPLAKKIVLPLAPAVGRTVETRRVENSVTSNQPSRGDQSWQRHKANEGSTGVEVRSHSPSLVPSAVPLSFVEQRKAMYNNLAKGPTATAPLPDLSRGSAVAQQWENDFSAPKSTPLPDFTRVAIPRKASEPNTGIMKKKFEELPMMPMRELPMDPKRLPNDDRAQTNGTTERPPAHQTAVVLPVPVTAPKIENPDSVGNTLGSITIEEQDKTARATRKQRTRAALARYRRIFRLGNNIGITGSPSFNSNNSKSVDEVGKTEKGATCGRAEFFARAKAVTGAWGIILTQELEEDSDSEDDDERQISEGELAAFGKLLDFWDNRRASATIVTKGEVVLDDDAATPLTEQDINSIRSLLAKLEPKREDEVTEVQHEEVTADAFEQGEEAEPTSQSEEIRQLLERDFSDPSVDSGSGGIPHSPGPRATSNIENSAPSLLRMSQSVDVLTTRLQQARLSGSPQTVPPKHPGAPGAPGTVPAVAPASYGPNRSGGVFPPPPYAPPAGAPDGAVSPPRLTVTQSTLRDPFRPKQPPKYPANQYPGAAALNDSFPAGNGRTDEKVTPAAGGIGGSIPTSVSLDANLHKMLNRKTSTEKEPMERKPSSSSNLTREESKTHSESWVGNNNTNSTTKNSTTSSTMKDDTATRGMFAFSMFSRKKSGAASSFDANLPLDKCLVEVGRILQSLGCSVMMKRGESKMKCEAPVRNSEKMLVSVTCTYGSGKTKVLFKKGRKDRSRVDAKEFYTFFQTVYNKFLEKIESSSVSTTS